MTATREAACSCGQLRLVATGDPFVVSMCHCLACQRRTGTAFGLQAAFSREQVQTTGRATEYRRISDEADRKEGVFHFCPACGATVWITEVGDPDLVVVPVGAFADPTFPAPSESMYPWRQHRWLELPGGRPSDPSRLRLVGVAAAVTDARKHTIAAAPHRAVAPSVRRR